jgi:hypothetical protein
MGLCEQAGRRDSVGRTKIALRSRWDDEQGVKKPGGLCWVGEEGVVGQEERADGAGWARRASIGSRERSGSRDGVGWVRRVSMELGERTGGWDGVGWVPRTVSMRSGERVASRDATDDRVNHQRWLSA